MNERQGTHSDEAEMRGEKMHSLPEPRIVRPFVGIALALLLLPACSPDETPIQPPSTLTISGKVIDLMSQMTPGGMPPIAGATVKVVSQDPDSTCRCECLDDGSELAAVSDQNGNWVLKDVPLTYDPETNQANSLLMKVTASGYQTTYDVYNPSLGDKYDLSVVSKLLYFFLALGEVLSGADPDTLCVMFGAVIGFTDMTYPPTSETIAGATAYAVGGTPPEPLEIVYLAESGLPDPALTATSGAGAFYLVVPDAGAVPKVTFSGTKPGVTLVGGDYPACPASVVPAGLIDPFYTP